MGFWFTVFLWALTFAAYVLLAPKPQLEHAKAAKLGDFRFPKTEEGSPVPIYYGRVRLRAPNVLWFGDLEAKPIIQKVKTGIFSSKRIITGYEYLLGLHLGLGVPASGVGGRLLRIWFDEDVAWSGDVSTDGAAVTLDVPSLFGGYTKGGGVVGTARFYTGSFTQTVNSYLSGVVPDGTLLPAYRGLTYLVFEHANLGESAYIKKISVELECIPNQLALGAVGGEGDANPAEVAYDILRSDWGKLGIESAYIDQTSFTTAGTTLATEGHGISLAIQAPNTGRDVLEEILRQVDAILYEEPATRQIKMRLIRDDYDAGTLLEFDESNVLEVVDWSKPMWHTTMNQARVLFNSRLGNYNTKPAVAQDLANITFQGKVRTAVVSYPGVTNATLANKLAARDLDSLSIPLIKARIAVNRVASTLRPGDVIKFTWPDYGVSQVLMRVQQFDLGDLADGRVVLDLIQDRFSVKDTILADPPATGHVQPTTAATAAAIRKVAETPRWLNLQGEAAGYVVDPDAAHLVHLAGKPTTLEQAFDAEISEDAGTTWAQDLDDAEFAVNAQVHTSYAQSAAPYDTSTGLRVKALSDTTVLGSATATDIRASGKNLVLVGDELVAYEGFTDNLDGTYTLTNVWRGLLDTTPVTHAVDERVWFLAAVGLEAYGLGEFAGTESLKARFLTDTGFAVLAPGDAAEDSLTLAQRAARPYCPADVQVGATRYPTSLAGQNQTVSWKRRDRLSAAIARGDDADETPTGEEYIIEWTLNGGGLNTQNMGSGASAAVDFGGTGTVVMEVYSRFTGPGLESQDRFGWTFTIT